MHSLKTKLIAGMTLLLIIAFSLSAALLIRQKSQELSTDIYDSIRSFSDLTAVQIVELYERYLSQESFVYFNREIQDLFNKTQEITGIGIADYNGTVLYDSSEEKTRQYTGDPRIITGSMLERIQATYPSYQLEDNRIIYLKTDEDGNLYSVNLYEKLVTPIQPSNRIINVIYPTGAHYAVLYSPSYAILDDRIQAMWMRIVWLSIIAILVGIVYAYFFSSSITRPLKKLQAGAIILGQGNFKSKVEIKTHDEVGSLAQTFNKMAADLERSMQAMAYKERVTKELELAAMIQKEILPKEMPNILGLDIAAGIIPAAEVGGDVYDFITLNEENYFGYVGDVTGHGVPAGLVVSIANALLDSFVYLGDPEKILIEANRILKKKTSANMFITLILWHWNTKNNLLTLVNAGHEVPLRYVASTIRTEELSRGGIALGMIPDITPLVKSQVIELKKGDCVILYTDGIPEAWRNEKDQYGMPEFKRVVTQSCDLDAAEAIKVALLADVKQWSQNYEQKDDMTVMVIKKT
ncbi:MAG: serine phosphatase, sigma-B regulation protein RsbU (phosphoserine phosphatase) [Candidatus Peregrinibacteria bacterium GW2011_GWE2_39_6]|nr:MAG: serine phosphatase, sigma-B regulation protein RsbU (phosphoserine phosphatase) [Candidatus Peregrinibacteria bacterium GW2011_GWF2_39_17]KKR26208.1 MAG: serine phosphatase, sigma-B regulation protein RsbU (phosphoserine phosphatase) [Candidatus Peregrinibacteria bacterium GW2011_GWE2_39_6]HCW32093.1 hypothetical protein [Candidatus Peregrinibacteria bacterium]